MQSTAATDSSTESITAMKTKLKIESLEARNLMTTLVVDASPIAGMTPLAVSGIQDFNGDQFSDLGVVSLRTLDSDRLDADDQSYDPQPEDFELSVRIYFGSELGITEHRYVELVDELDLSWVPEIDKGNQMVVRGRSNGFINHMTDSFNFVLPDANFEERAVHLTIDGLVDPTEPLPFAADLFDFDGNGEFDLYRPFTADLRYPTIRYTRPEYGPDIDRNQDGIVNLDDAVILCRLDHQPEAYDILEAANLPLGDMDGDGLVGFADFLTLSGNFGRGQDHGEGRMLYTDGDIDCNGFVNFDDFLTFSREFRTEAPERILPSSGRAIV